MPLMLRRAPKVPQVQQLTQTECGLAATLMVMQLYGSKESLRDLRDEFDPGRDGLTVRQLRGIFRSRGFESQMYRAGNKALRRIQLPAVIYWQDYHFVVLEQVTDRYAVIVDPASGRRRVPIADFVDSFSGVVITAEPRDDFVPLVSTTKNPWPEYLKPMLGVGGRLSLVLLMSLLLFATSMVVPLITRYAVDARTGHAQDLFVGGSFSVVAFGVSYLLMMLIRTLVVSQVTAHIGRETMDRIFSHLLYLPYKFFATRAPGELLFRLSSVNQVRDLMSSQLAQGALDVMLSICMVGMMFFLDPVLAAVAVLCYLVVFGLLLGTRRLLGEALDAEISQTAKSQSMQLESVVSVTALKLSGSEGRYLQEWRETYERAIQASMRNNNLRGMIAAGTSATQVVAPLLILLVGLREVVNGDATIGTVVAFQSVVSTFFGLANSVFSCWTLTVQTRTYLDRLSDITNTPVIRDDGQCTEPITGDIELRGVSYRYSKHAPASLENVDLQVLPGEKIAVVGRSGSGKSTLGRVLCGLLEPTSGEVLYNGRPLSEYPRPHFYDHVGYIPQEVHLLNRSVLDNITMGHPALGEDDVRMAARESQVAADIQALPMQYQTLVSEMGGNFSGGQRQRIALARALVRRPRVLIMDEATSALDTVNEARISTTLAERSCTVIVIAHRLSTVVDCDRIYVMDEGRIVQVGRHEELLAEQGIYQQLFASAMTEAV